jgi:hypothetical protein
MKFRYEAFTKIGHVKRGFLEANSEEEGSGQLRAMGLFVQKIEVDGPNDMKAVLPGGDPMPDKPIPPQWITALIDPATSRELGLGSTDNKPKVDWHYELESNLKTIAEIVSYVESCEALKDVPKAAIKAGKEMAYAEMIKQTLLRAAKSAI